MLSVRNPSSAVSLTIVIKPSLLLDLCRFLASTSDTNQRVICDMTRLQDSSPRQPALVGAQSSDAQSWAELPNSLLELLSVKVVQGSSSTGGSADIGLRNHSKVAFQPILSSGCSSLWTHQRLLAYLGFFTQNGCPAGGCLLDFCLQKLAPSWSAEPLPPRPSLGLSRRLCASPAIVHKGVDPVANVSAPLHEDLKQGMHSQ